MHFRLEVGKWWLHIGKDEPQQDEPDRPPFIDHHPTPQTIYSPERVGFVQLPQEGD